MATRKRYYMYAVSRTVWRPNYEDDYYSVSDTEIVSVHFSEESANKKASALNSRVDTKYKDDIDADLIRGVHYNVTKVEVML